MYNIIFLDDFILERQELLMLAPFSVMRQKLITVFAQFLDTKGIKHTFEDDYTAVTRYELPYIPFDIFITVYGEYDLALLLKQFEPIGRKEFLADRQFKLELVHQNDLETMVYCSVKTASDVEVWVNLRLDSQPIEVYTDTPKTGMQLLESIINMEPTVVNCALSLWLVEKLDIRIVSEQLCRRMHKNFYTAVEDDMLQDKDVSWLLGRKEDGCDIVDFLMASSYWFTIQRALKAGKVEDDEELGRYLSDFVSQLSTDLWFDLSALFAEEPLQPFDFDIEVESGVCTTWLQLALV